MSLNNPSKIKEEFYERFVSSRPGHASDFESNSNDIQEPDQLLETDPEKVLDFILEKLGEQKEEGIRNIRDNFNKMMILYSGNVPYIIFKGKADEKEKTTIYSQALEDAISIIKQS